MKTSQKPTFQRNISCKSFYCAKYVARSLIIFRGSQVLRVINLYSTVFHFIRYYKLEDCVTKRQDDNLSN